jgi:hypothetical protein
MAQPAHGEGKSPVIPAGNDERPAAPPDGIGRLVIARLSESESWWRKTVRTLPREKRLALFDKYYELAEWLQTLPGGIGKPGRRRAFDNLMDFAWHINDLAAEYHAELRQARRRRLPAYARPLRDGRRRGMVPCPVNGIHASIGFAHGYRPAAPGAFVLSPRGVDPDGLDFSYLTGLDVEILATGADFPVPDFLGNALAAQGVNRVTLRRLDFPQAKIELLYDGSRPWRL